MLCAIHEDIRLIMGTSYIASCQLPAVFNEKNILLLIGTLAFFISPFPLYWSFSSLCLCSSSSIFVLVNSSLCWWLFHITLLLSFSWMVSLASLVIKTFYLKHSIFLGLNLVGLRLFGALASQIKKVPTLKNGYPSAYHFWVVEGILHYQ